MLLSYTLELLSNCLRPIFLALYLVRLPLEEFAGIALRSILEDVCYFFKLLLIVPRLSYFADAIFCADAHSSTLWPVHP